MRKYFSIACAAACILALGLCGFGCGPSASQVNKLRETLKGGDTDQKQNACIELGNMKEGASPAIPELTAALNDRDVTVRRLAAYALGQIGPKAKSAVPELKKHMIDVDQSVMLNVVNALRNISPNEVKDIRPVNTK